MKKLKLLLGSCLITGVFYAQNPIIYTFAGTGTAGYTGNGGFATQARLSGPEAITIDGNGNIYVADNGNHVIRKITPTGIISTVAGNGTAGFLGDGGQATAARLNGPAGVAIDGSGNLYISDQANHRIRKVTSGGVISTVAGSGTAGWVGDGSPATNYRLSSPDDICLDPNNSDHLYIADGGNNMVRKLVLSTSTISIFAGKYNGGVGGFSGDGAAATNALLNTPSGVWVDGSGDVFIADKINNRIRKVSGGNISTICGTGTASYTGNGGQATAATINSPSGVCKDGSGNIYIADNLNWVVRKINTSGVISTYAGNNIQGYQGDGGLATNARIDVDYGIYCTSGGDVLLADYQNSVCRRVSVNCPAIAGPNKTNTQDCCTLAWLSVQIGSPSQPNMAYSWTPSTSLNSTTVAQPQSSWSNTVTCQVYTVSVSYSLCTTSTSTVQVCAQRYTGELCCRMMASNMQPINSFQVFPNPASEQVEVTLYDKADYVRVFDVNGKVVFEAFDVTDAEYFVDVSQYDKGIYFVTAKIGETIENQKIIRQ